MGSHKTRKQKMLILAMSIFVLILLAVALWLIHRWEKREDERRAEILAQQSDDDKAGLVRYNGEWYRPRENLETVLLIGIDKTEEQISGSGDDFLNDQQADFLALLIVDRPDNSYSVLQLNRDIMAAVPQLDLRGEEYGTKEMQLALAHTYGSGSWDSCRNTAKAVSNLLYGVPVDHYISVTMDGVALLNDLVGGVTVYVEDDFSQADPTIVQGQNITLRGKQALTFVRARGAMTEPTNLNRMARQRVYLEALYKQILHTMEAEADFPLRVLNDLSEYMVSDCSVNEMAELCNTVSLQEEFRMETVQGEAVIGEQFMEYYVDEDALQAQVIDLFYTKVDK